MKETAEVRPPNSHKYTQMSCGVCAMHTEGVQSFAVFDSLLFTRDAP